ncbi:UDP-N-acetylmuramoyl-tripeptide--D-alanyl-D-alanine ligase [Staphylospora marina]|uniref:UDP-N-acetylmuramoyl-tripeptide--D-alanyl-D- alanine ligase n=1 Tax=Staphylospora marina TaxID=2490858 RepID=UPI000F5C15BE|nr:UDP-N-acetylmuramoyl-tripeptide--D-alanyl-D-alanine ligase [Staphylospora marina]
MKTIPLKKLMSIIGGTSSSHLPQALVSSVNFGRPRSLRHHQVYFYTREISWSKQLSAIRAVKPVAVVLPHDQSSAGIPPDTGIIRVKDAFSSFWKLALWNFKQCPVRVIGISGSSGKSTTTAMTASILRYRWPMVRTEGNLNTWVFLPTYLTRLTPDHKLLLLEMGMKSLNNIRRQCAVVKPEIGAVTNVGEAHAGSLGGLDKVVLAKQELVDGIRRGGTLFLNADDARSRKLSVKRFSGRVYTFGIKNNADVRATNIRYNTRGMSFDANLFGQRISCFIPIFGIHNVYNALAAMGIARAFGASVKEIRDGLASFKPPGMRLQFLKGRSGRILINDAWNANPTSMKAGLEVLRHIFPDRTKIAVLGDMKELGDLTYEGHSSIGRFAAGIGLSQLVTIGRGGRLIAHAAIKAGMDRQRVYSYDTHDQLVAHLIRKTPPGSLIYFKASRSMHLEKVVDRLR